MTCSSGEATLTTETMTSAEYDNVHDSVKKLYERLPLACNATYCPQADWTGCALRVAGHDFMDFRDSTGGSDGCLDLHDADNSGLHECLYRGEFGVSLHDAYEEHCTKVSLADFLVIAAETVMEITRANVLGAPPLNFRAGFRYGRTTSVECPWAHERLPDPEKSCTAVETTFVNSMGLSWTQAAALMGVHSLGRAHLQFSGFNGWWSDFENSRRFNNNYFLSILAKGWQPEKLSTGKHQWMRADVGTNEVELGKEMMLNTDMCLAFTFDEPGDVELRAAEHDCCGWVDPSEIRTGYTRYLNGEFCGDMGDDIPGGRGPEQRVRCCGPFSSSETRVLDCGSPATPRGPAYDAVKSFANDEEEWLQAFLPAWRIATENGFSNLKSLQ